HTPPLQSRPALEQHLPHHGNAARGRIGGAVPTDAAMLRGADRTSQEDGMSMSQEQPGDGRWADAQLAEGAEEPYYLPVGDEVEICEAACERELPVMLKGPTGVGKTRFLRYMAHRLGRPLITVACHDDLTASDLLGRYLIKGDETVWIDGPLTYAARIGAICYLDEIVEARKDTTVVIHPLTDDRRRLRLEKTGELIVAPPEFLLVISYNPGYQSLMKNLKPSTRQRFVAIDFNFPPPEVETEIVVHESGVDRATAEALVKLAGLIRNL